MTLAQHRRRIRILPAGDRALLVEPEDHVDLGALASVLRASGTAGISDVLPAAQTILVTTDARVDLRTLARTIRQVLATADHLDAEAPPDSETLYVPVSYDGCDLHDVATILGISVADVIREHTSRTWRCEFLGFAPGFGYLVSDTPGLSVPRRVRSRTSVPPGAIALADGYSAIYPRRSPGGWQIIGTTTLSTWDAALAQPASIWPGRRVRFVAEADR